MRLCAAFVVCAGLALGAVQAFADETPVAPDPADSQADAAPGDATPTVTTRTLDPPTVVDPFGAPAASTTSTDVDAPLNLSPQAQPQVPPGPPNRLP